MILCYIVTLLAACVSGFVLFAGVGTAKGAPQEASAAAIALCIVVIPYVFTRVCQMMQTARWQEQMLKIADKSTNQS